MRRGCTNLLRLILFLVASTGLLGQADNEVYFSLSSSQTFGPNDTAKVRMSAWNVQSLEFRVYRVNDPQKFFLQLDAPHNFGGRAPTPPRRKTLLEELHSWKHRLKADIRRALRGQFTDPPSAHFTSKPQPAVAKTGQGSAVTYVEIPVLNSQQLVSTFVQPVSGHDRWESQEVEVKAPGAGVYLVEAVAHNLRAYTILMVSDIVLVTKVGKGRIVTIVMDRNTGQPAPNTPVVAVSRKTEPVGAETNAEGIAELNVVPPPNATLTILAGKERNVAVTSIQGGDYGPNADQWTGFVYTDRPVYRPGHPVHFKAILRQAVTDGYRVPAGEEVLVQISAGGDKTIYQKTLKVSANGTIHDDLTLARDAPLGFYYIAVIKGKNHVANGSMEVEEYKKPEYEVRVTPGQTRVIQGANVPVTIDAQYFFGEPVAGAKVKYSVYRERYWYGLWYNPSDDDEGGNADAGDSGAGPDEGGDQLSNQEAILDKDGKLTIQVPTAIDEHKRDLRYRVQVGVTDAGNREITGNGWIVATYGSFAIYVEPDKYVYKPGSTASFTVDARDYDRHPVKTRAHVELLKYNFRDRSEPVVDSADVNLDGATGKVEFKIPSGGDYYRVRATAKTPEGREVEGTSYVWVSGEYAEFDYARRGQSVQMVTDKRTYRAGETATILIVAGEPNTAVYVSVEGRDIRQYKLLRAVGGTVTFELPLTANDEPGVSVNAAFVRKGVLYSSTKVVKVPPVEHELQVKLSTDKPQYLPGQSAEYSIDVTGNDGKAVPKAEFSLGVVNEAIYGVRRDATPSILSVFYEREYNRVPTDSSLEYFFTGEAGHRRMQLAALRPRSRLAQLKPERLVQPKVRKNFPDTAFWAADLVTDNAGHARAKVEFPDSLTTWRATARGITPDTRVGSATLKTIVRKNLILRLNVPRFFVQGDEVVIAGLVHNYLKDAKTARVSLEVKGLEIVGGATPGSATKDVQIAARGEARVEWRVRAQKVRGATLTAKALTNEESDALELELPVNIPGVKLTVAKGGSMAAANGSASFDIAFPANVEAGSRSLSIRLTPSIAGSLFDALEYLTQFPYGCVEQTMSSFLPNIIVKAAVKELELKSKVDNDVLAQKIRAGIDRLNSFQHPDGGWGWWETDESHPFMTAYVVAGFAQARAAGVTDVEQPRIDRGVEWLKKNLAADPKLAYDLRAYMIYALTVAGKADSAALSEVYENRGKLSSYGLAIAGLALDQAKDARATALAGELEQMAKQDGEQAWWPATRDAMLDFSADVTPEATAYALKFLAHQRKDSPLLAKAAFWLMMHRDEGYWWHSTKQTAMVIYGLTDYLKVSNELKPEFTATVYVNDAIAVTRKIDASTDLSASDFTLSESKLSPGVNKIRVTSSGAGRVYYSVRGDYYSSDPRAEKQGTVSLNLLRDYFTLVPGRKEDRIVYDLKPLDHAVAPGDIIAVRLTVTGSEWNYLLIEDPIPAGTELIEKDNNYELRDRPIWWRYYYNRRELHDDRVAIFQTYFSSGQQYHFYLLKVVNPGLFQVSPARVSPMYQPSILATTEKRTLEVK